jgi:HTH-type transcriptional regulator/antitoxin MqsA
MMCGICGGEATLVHEPHTLSMGTRVVTIDDEFIRCARCGETYYIDGMEDVTLRRATAKIRAEDGLLAPDDIVALRGKYGLTQADLEQLIGSGEKTVVRWERGNVVQNKTADTLLRVLGDHPEVVAQLAAERGVVLQKRTRAKPRASTKKAAPTPVRRARVDAAG